MTKLGIALPNYGQHSHPDHLGEIAVIAEQHGWDGIFLYDTILMPGTEGVPISDAWIDLAVMAERTSTIALGVLVTPLPRHRPWQIARMATTLDHLSGGRFILGAGTGDTNDRAFGAFGEPTDAKIRAQLLDEGLEITNGLWSGEPLSFDGAHFTVDAATFTPKPTQNPRIPIWIAFQWPKRRPTERAARWDGAMALVSDGAGQYRSPSPDEIHAMREELNALRGNRPPIEIIIDHKLMNPGAEEHDRVRGIAEAGASWVIEFVPSVDDAGALIEGIRTGPPTLQPAGIDDREVTKA